MAQIVGQVELEVVPNDQNFNRNLQQIIDKASSGVRSTNIKPNIDTSGIEAGAEKLTKSASAAADQATAALSGITPDMDTSQFEAASAQVEAAAEASASRASASFQRIAIGVGVAAAAMYGLKQASDVVIGSLSKLFDNLLKAQAGFEAILGGVQGNELLADIQEFARVTPFSTEGLVQYSQQLLGVGRSAESIIPTLQSVGDLVASKGGDTNTINRVLFTLTQIQSVGRLIGQDALQLQSALIPITKLLADSMGKTQAEIKKLSAAGKISAETVFKTLEEAGLDVAGAMEGATRNISGAKEGLLDTVTILAQKSPVLQSINADIVQAIKNLTEFLGSDRVAEITDNLAVSLESLYKSTLPLFQTLSEVSGDAILSLLEASVPLVETLATAISAIPVPVLTALGVFLAFNKFQTFISGFGKVVSLLQNFQGAIGNVAAGLGRATNALATESKVTVTAQAQQAALVRTYQQSATAATSAAAASNAYTQALQRQNQAAQAAVSQAFRQAPTGPQIDPNTGLPLGQRASRFAGGGRTAALGGAAGAAGLLALSQSGNVDGFGGQVLGVGGAALTGAAVGAQFGVYGAAIGAAAGAGFGVFQEFQKSAREDALEKAKEWGEIGEESAKEFVEGFEREYNVDIVGGTSTESERITASAQVAADVATLQVAARTGLVTSDTKAAADRLGVKLETTKPQTGDQLAIGEEAIAQLDSELANGDAATFELIDKEAFEKQIADISEFGSDLEVETQKKRAVIESIVANPIAAGWFDDIREQEIDEILGPFGNLGDRFRPNLEAGADIFGFDIVGRSLGVSFDKLNKFGVSLEDAEKLADKVAFYFSDILDNIQGSVDESFKFNNSLEETKTFLDSLNKERLKEGSTRLGLLKQEEEYTKKIAALAPGADDNTAAQLVLDGLKLAAAQAAEIAADQGLDPDEAAARQNEIFGAYVTDIREQGELTDEQLNKILETLGLLDDFEAASSDNESRATFLREEVERLTASVVAGGPAGAAAIGQRIAAYEEELAALEGVSTEETRAQAARDRRNAQALGILKSAEALDQTYADLGVSALLAETTVVQFGEAAQQAFQNAALAGENEAETNQIFVDTLENIQLVLGYTDQELRTYLDSVGLLDAYNKALEDSNIGVQTTIADLGEQYGINTQLIRDLLGVAENIPNDITIYINAETQQALADLNTLREEAEAVRNDPNLTEAEKFRERFRLGREYQEGLDALEASGGDINATVGAQEEAARQLAEEEAEKAAREAEKIARENERIANEAERAADALQNSIDSASATLENAIQSAADAIEQAAEAWKSDIKERTQYDPAVSASRLANNADRQATDLTELTAGISTLRARGVSQEVLDALGIDNVADLRQVRKLVGSDDSDLARLTESVSTRDKLATSLAKSEEDKRNRDNITTAIVAAASILGFDDFDPNRASSIANNINIDQGADTDALTAQILGLLSGGKIGR